MNDATEKRETPEAPDWRLVKGQITRDERVALYDYAAGKRAKRRFGHGYYHAELERFHRLNIPEGRSVLQIGCGLGNLLASVKPSRGVGIDFSPEMVRRARENYPDLEFIECDAESLALEETFDYIVLCNVVGDFSDVWQVFQCLRAVSRPDTRIIVTYYNYLWEPLIKFGERIAFKIPQFCQNWLSIEDLVNLFELNGFQTIRSDYRILLPFGIPLLSGLCNRVLAKLPFIRKLCLMNFVVARCIDRTDTAKAYSVSVIIPTRNEAGNVERAVAEIPDMGTHTELLFVDGDSTDGTVEKIEALIEENKGKKDIKLIHQVPRGGPEAHTGKMLKLGKGDAVRKGFDAATGDILMILDSDLTVPPADLPKFYAALAEARGEFVNGTRLVYQMEKEAMRVFNLFANKVFSIGFTWLLEQRIKDTLCGTKVLFKRDYEAIKANREFFGDFDPFGDFDLLFGAAKLNLHIVEVPVRYRARTSGDIKIERWKHGILLLKMCFIALRKLKLA